MYEQLINYLKRYLNLLDALCKECLASNTYLEMLWCRLIKKEVELMINNLKHNHHLDVARSLKLLLECGIQSLYLYSKYEGDSDKIFKELRRRSRLGVSFNMSMISRIPNLNPRVKKELVKTYLEVSKYVHPTIELLNYEEGIALKQLITRSLDMTTYLACRICGKEKVLAVKSLILELGLERSAKYLRLTG